jgi:hypothetical protein
LETINLPEKTKKRLLDEKENLSGLTQRDLPQLAAATGLAFALGFPAGLGVWIFWRLVRFAAKG